MGTMATLMPTTTFSTVDSTPPLSSSTFHRPVASQENLKISQRTCVFRIGRHGHGSANVLSVARGVCREFSQRLDSASTRCVFERSVDVIQNPLLVRGILSMRRWCTQQLEVMHCLVQSKNVL